MLRPWSEIFELLDANLIQDHEYIAQWQRHMDPNL